MPTATELIEGFLVAPYPVDPYPLYDELRDKAPVARGPGGLWFASSYDAALTVFRSPALGQGRGNESRLRRSSAQDANHIVQDRAGARGDDRNPLRCDRDWAFPGCIEETFGLEFSF